MSRLACLCAAICLTSLACAADLPLKPFSYHETFEGKAPEITLWASRGTPPTVNFLGVSTEQAFEGRQSLKLDITLGDSSYYYYGMAMRVPMAGKLDISARLRLGEENQARASFGVNAVFPPTTHSGCCVIESVPKGPEWKQITGDLVTIGRDTAAGVIPKYVYGATGGDVASVVDRWAIFITGQPGQRAVVYLDDVRIEGEVPEEGAYIKQAQASFTARQAAFRQEVADLTKELEQRKAVVAQVQGAAADAPALVARVNAGVARADELLTIMNKQVYGSPQEIAELRQILLTLQNAPQTLQTIQRAKAAGRNFVAYPWNSPTTLQRATGPGGEFAPSAGGSLATAACPGEYESVSAFIHAFQDLPGLRVSCSDLKGPAGTIPASAVDMYIVKAWYQGASNNIGYTPKKWLIPELLLKDDDLVRVDVEKETNFLRSTKEDGTQEYLVCSDPDSSNLAGVRPVDAATLQPVNLKAGDSREFWLTIRTPEQAKAGTYQGSVTFTADGGSFQLPLSLTVHPFTLEPSRLTYSIYYRARLSEDGQPYIDSERRSEEQYRAEMADMLAHGVLYPTNYQGFDEPRLTKQLQIRKEVGLPGGRFYNLGQSIGPTNDVEGLKGKVRQWIAFLKPWGYDEVYFYGTDEATGERLMAQKASWGATQEAGGKTFVACYKKTFEAMGKLLNTAVLAQVPDPEEAKKWHSVGSEAFCYANPQVGVEDPQVYRRNFGLLLWHAGFDGAMDYAYQHGFTHVWNDFDNRTYRDHNFTYPTVNGIVGTIAWEGFREAVDDVRYVTTLEKAIANAPAGKRAAAAEAKKWLEGLDPARGDLDAIRKQMVEWIIKLR